MEKDSPCNFDRHKIPGGVRAAFIDDSEVDGEKAANTGANQAVSIGAGSVREEQRISQCTDEEDEQKPFLALLWLL